MIWHTQDTGAVLKELGSRRSGLSESEAAERLVQYGENVLVEKGRQPAWLIFLNQFRDFMILVLAVAAVISGFVGELTDSIIILIIILLNAVLGFIQEYKAEKAMEALKQMAAVPARVIRNNQSLEVPASVLVPGDVVLLEAGNIIPADLRLLESNSLRVDEAPLTGESHAVDKTTAAIGDESAFPGDRLNMAFRGTTVAYGRGLGVVTTTGMNTEMGRIANLLQEPESQTPLQKRMAVFGRQISFIILFLCALFFLAGYLRGEDPMQMLLVAISLAVAAIPEALPALIAVALSIGASRMVKQNALVRRLPAVETLGSVTYICTDKTGTLTQNKMQVVDHRLSEPARHLQAGLPNLFVSMALNNDAFIRDGKEPVGDPTEIAMLQFLFNLKDAESYAGLPEKLERLAEIPFDSDRKCMSTLHRFHGEYLSITKGAAESIAGMTDQGSADQLLQDAEDLASRGIRVLAFGIRVLKEFPNALTPEFLEQSLEYTGLVGMIDPPREEVKEAIRECKTAGIHPVMITGDHPSTAEAIAREAGILTGNHQVMNGREMQKLNLEELSERVEEVRVYARVTPEQKLNIVKALQLRNHYVAMTGDGVNDAPSLKRADIGIAMGITGTQVSKEAADMILLDDNFATIIKAVKEGRRIFDNIRRFTKYVLTCNTAELWTILLAPLLGLPIPLLPIHILWINLVTDGLPGVALGYEKAESNIMNRPPRPPDENLFAQGLGWHVVWVGLLMAVITLSVQAFTVYEGNENWQTMVFTVLCLSQMGHVLAIRSESEFLYRHGFFSNQRLIASVLLTFLLQLATIYLPFANVIFKTQPLSLAELAACIGLSAVIFHAVELEKWVKSRITGR